MLEDIFVSSYHCPNTKGDYYAKGKLQKKVGHHSSYLHFVLFFI